MYRDAVHYRVAGCGGHQPRLDRSDGLLGCGNHLLRILATAVQRCDGYVAGADVLARQHHHARLGIESGRLLGGHDDVRIVREDQDGFGIQFAEGLHEALGRRVHRLATFDHGIRSGLLEGLYEPVTGSHRHHAIELALRLDQRFVRLCLRRFEIVPDGGLLMLERHVLDLERQVLAPLLAVVQDFARSLRVDVHLHDAALLEADHRFANGRQPVADHSLVEGGRVAHLGALQAQQEFRAVAEFQLAVLGEKIEVRGLMGGLGRRLKVFVSLFAFALQGVQHAAGNAEHTGTAAVHHPRLFQHGQQFRGALERGVHFRYKRAEVGFEIAAVFRTRRTYRVLQHREDGSFHRHGDCSVGRFHAAVHGNRESRDVGLRLTGQSLGDARKDA